MASERQAAQRKAWAKDTAEAWNGLHTVGQTVQIVGKGSVMEPNTVWDSFAGTYAKTKAEAEVNEHPNGTVNVTVLVETRGGKVLNVPIEHLETL